MKQIAGFMFPQIYLYLMIDSFERGYYEETLPNFISGYLERYMKRKMQYNINSIGYLQFKLFHLVQKRLERIRFIEIFLREVDKLLSVVKGELNEDSHNFQYLKYGCMFHIYIWKLKDQMQGRKKQSFMALSGNENQQKLDLLEKQQKWVQKIIWDLKVQSEMINPGNFQLVMIQMFREVSDSQRLSQKFKARMRSFLQTNDISPVDKFMKILGEEASEEQNGSFVVSNSVELTPGNSVSEINQSGIFQQSQCLKSSYSKQTPTYSQNRSNNGSNISMIEGHKKIFKNNKMCNGGRTIFMSHPIRHRMQKEQKTKEVIEYVEKKQLA